MQFVASKHLVKIWDLLGQKCPSFKMRDELIQKNQKNSRSQLYLILLTNASTMTSGESEYFQQKKSDYFTDLLLGSS